MSSLPTGNTQVKVPALTKIDNASVRYANLDRVKNLIYPEKVTPATYQFATSTNTVVNIPKSSISSNKITIDGKVVDINVLTKLQQQNGGNIVSFTASKEFLSNIASAKFNVAKPVANSASKKQDISVFKMAKPSQIVQTTSKKSQEKLLLPKTHANGYIHKSTVEVTKFAPEMKGLLTGLSTALKTAVTTSNVSPHSFQLLKTTNVHSVTNSNFNTFHKGKGGSVLIALKTSGKPSTTKPIITALPINNSSARPLPAISTFKTNITTRTVIKPVIQHATVTKPLVQSIISNKPLLNQTTTTSYFEKASSVSASMETGRIHLFRKNMSVNAEKDIKSTGNTKYLRVNTSADIRKNITNMANDNKPHFAKKSVSKEKSSFQMQHILNFDQKQNPTTSSNSSVNKGATVTTKHMVAYQGGTTVMNKSDVQEKKENIKISGFTELYERAVQNVLNIKSFTDDLSKTEDHCKSVQDFEKAFQSYLEKPMDIDKKIKRRLYTLPSSNEEPTLKKIKQENKCKNLLPKSSDREYSPTLLDKISSNDIFDFKTDVSKTRPRNSRKSPDLENMKFFSQFLSDQSYSSKKNNSHSNYTYSDFPWLHPQYLYDRYYQHSSTYYPSYYRDYHKSHAMDDDIHPRDDGDEKSGNEHTRMKLNTVKKSKAAKKEIDIVTDISPDEEVTKICKNTKGFDKVKLPASRSNSAQEKRNKSKESLKYRPYTLRQRALLLKKEKKLGKTKPPEQPKFILKELTGKGVTKKEHFLGSLGLRRILKRLDKKEKESR